MFKTPDFPVRGNSIRCSLGSSAAIDLAIAFVESVEPSEATQTLSRLPGYSIASAFSIFALIFLSSL